MKRYLVLACVLLGLVSPALSQSSKQDKKMEAVYKLLDKRKYKEADEALEDLLAESPDYGKGWDLLTRLRYKEYEDARSMDGIFSNIQVSTTVKDKDGKEKPADDSLSKKFVGMLREMSPSKIAYSKYIYTLRQSQLRSEDACLSAAKLRALFVDVEVDTAVGKKALKYYNNAEEEFGKKNYENAAKLYRRALDEQPDFYKAGLYMGDCFYFTENYPAAAEAFKSASDRFPYLLEPRKYLIDSYGKQKLYDKCLEASIAAMAVYPDPSVLMKMDDAAYYLDKKIQIKWTPRPVFPNRIQDSTRTDLNTYKPAETPKVKDPWTYYQASQEKIAGYCNAKGLIVMSNSLTQSKYMELYGWEEMLKNSNDPSLEEARRMQKDGYLDCYVLVSCFHYDFYDQYLDFAKNNKDRIAAYYKKYITKN